MSAADIVYSGVLKGIESGRLVPGQQLSERRLCEEFDVSRSSVREALNRLRGGGWISQAAEHGATVCTVGEHEVVERLPIIANLLGLAARLAANQVKSLEARKQIIDAHAGFTGYGAAEHSERRKAIRRFYVEILEASENPSLRQILKTIRAEEILVARIITHGGGSPMGPARRVADAILSRNAQEAERAARDLVERLAGS